MTEPRPLSPVKERLLRAGIVAGALMVFVPIMMAMVGIHRAASGVPDGLRGATHIPSRKESVEFAFSSTSLVAIFAPSGVLLGVICGLTLMGEKKRREATSAPSESVE